MVSRHSQDPQLLQSSSIKEVRGHHRSHLSIYLIPKNRKPSKGFGGMRDSHRLEFQDGVLPRMRKERMSRLGALAKDRSQGEVACCENSLPGKSCTMSTSPPKLPNHSTIQRMLSLANKQVHCAYPQSTGEGLLANPW